MPYNIDLALVHIAAVAKSCRERCEAYSPNYEGLDDIYNVAIKARDAFWDKQGKKK